MKLFRLILIAGILTAFGSAALWSTNEKPVSLTILHTNDMHSHIFPSVLKDGRGAGGWAYLAEIIKTEKEKNPLGTMVLDGGDFLMGTLLHTISREEAPELRLMKEMGYDAVTLGNHEFDLKPKGLARIIESAQRHNGLPLLINSNAVFSKESVKDDSLERVYEKGLVKQYAVIERKGVKIGLFGLMGKDAAEVAPFAKPVTFSSQEETARKTVSLLRNKEKVDVVILLSHSGINDDPEKSEDEILARRVDGIDIIVSGHTHSDPGKPLVVNNTVIVQAGAYSRKIGRLDFNYTRGRVNVTAYRGLKVDPHGRADAKIAGMLRQFSSTINSTFLKGTGLTLSGVVAESSYPLIKEEKESPLGNLVTDSMIWYAQKMMDKAGKGEKVHISIISNGLIRENIYPGRLTAGDLFNVLPLGIGSDDTLGYPLVSLYVTGEEIKRALEILTSIYPLKGEDYYLQLSGLKFTYNPYRMIFDRVTSISIKTDKGYVPLDYSSENKRLYCAVSDIYNATFLKLIGGFTHGILEIVPKKRDGSQVKSLSDMRIDMDPGIPGIQETKEWRGFIEYIRSFPDINHNGIIDLPQEYTSLQGRIVKKPSMAIGNLISHATFVTLAAMAGIALVLLVLLFFVRLIVKTVSK